MTNWPNCVGLGRSTKFRLLLVAHFGTGPVGVSMTLIPRAWAAAINASSRAQLPAGYASGLEALKLGFVLRVGDGANCCQ